MQKDRSDSFSENFESSFDNGISGNLLDRSDNEERDRDRRGRGRDRGNARMSDRDRSPRGKKRGNRVFVSNIPYEFRWQELKDLFREKVGEVSFVELFVDESDKPRGCGIIEFATSDLAKEAVEKMHRHDLKGRKLVVKEDNDNERDKYGRILSRNERNRREPERSWNDIPSLINGPQTTTSVSQKWGNSYGLSTQFLESLNINGPLVPRCFVANLDYKVDDKKLKEVFRLAGRVISAEISTDKEGKSRGFGVVEYEHPVEAVQAISMLHNQTLFDRRLSVRMDRIDKGDGVPAKLPDGLKGLGMGLGANGVPLQDVARNLPSSQQNANPAPTPVVPPLSAVSNPALAAAALVNNLMAGTGTASDITSLAANSLGLNTAALTAGANPLAAQLLSSAAAASSGAGSLNPFVSSNTSGGRDFDSLSAALTSNSSFNQSASSNDRSRSGGMSSSLQATSDTIIIKNLPPTITWQMLREKCRDAGDVTFAEIKNKDTGIVRFASQWDAQRAINMLDRIRVEGRVIDVRFF